jgi:hypothetical protein
MNNHRIISEFLIIFIKKKNFIFNLSVNNLNQMRYSINWLINYEIKLSRLNKFIRLYYMTRDNILVKLRTLLSFFMDMKMALTIIVTTVITVPAW